jgi:hypothetical protein
VAPPPLKAYLVTLLLICLGVSLTKMALFWSLALILPLSPCGQRGGRQGRRVGSGA